MNTKMKMNAFANNATIPNNAAIFVDKICFIYKRNIITTKKQCGHNRTADEHINVFSKQDKTQASSMNTPGDNRSSIRFLLPARSKGVRLHSANAQIKKYQETQVAGK